MTNRTAMNAFAAVMPVFTWLINFVIPGRNARILAMEASNKGHIMTLVNGLASYVDAEFKTPVQTIVEKCYALGPFPALWAIEGTGKDICEWHMARNPKPARIMPDAKLDPQWEGAWLMLHAGMGMGFAKYYVDRMKTKSNDEIRNAVVSTVDLCRANSRPGYFGAAMESLGLVSRFMGNSSYCRSVHNVLTDYAPDAVGFFWRGVGRAVYFHPINFMPGFLHPCRAIKMCAREAPNAEMRENMLAGMAWAMTVVNMTTPQVMEWILENHDDYFSGSPGFFNGVVSSVVMRFDTTPGLDLIQQFMKHKPDSRNQVLTGLWNSKIKGSLETAMNMVYPVLKKHQRLDEVFHYQSLPALAARLENQPESVQSTVG
jgi:hypothetical protein